MKTAKIIALLIWTIAPILLAFLVIAILESQTDYLTRYRARNEWRQQTDETKRAKEAAADILGDDYVRQLELVKQYEDLAIEQFIAGKKLGKFETVKDYIAFRKIEAVGKEHQGFHKLILDSPGNGYANKLSYFLKAIENYNKNEKNSNDPKWVDSYARLKKIIKEN